MIPNVTQQNVRLFIPHKVAKICDAICRSDHISAAQAVARFYRTRLARQLGDERSKSLTTTKGGGLKCEPLKAVKPCG